MALALDGTPVIGSQASGTTVTSGTLTTTGGSGQIVCAIASNGTSVVSVIAAGLTFNQRKTITNTQGPGVLAEYVATYSTNFSGTITVTFSVGNQYGEISAWAISGASLAADGTEFDPGVGIPGSSTSTTSSITTANANDFVYSINGLSAATDTPGAGWTLINTSGFLLCQYQIVAATGSFTCTTGGGDTNASIIDAIIQGTAPPPVPPPFANASSLVMM